VQISNQRILIISPERWGVNFLSKHHYAVTLARRNNEVFFLNPPSNTARQTASETVMPNLHVIDYPAGIKGVNRAIWIPFLADFVNRRKIDSLYSVIPKPHIVWSFDPFRFQNLRLFDANLSIFHPVDYYQSRIDIVAAKSADIIFSVSNSILSRYSHLSPPAFFINHGVSDDYLSVAVTEKKDNVVRCGYVGNLLSKLIQHTTLARIVSENPAVEFNFIGPSTANNLGSVDDAGNPIHRLASLPNVIFHGQKPPREVARLINSFDMFLICYDQKRIGDATNNHKILEYLSTGKIVVSSKIETYELLASGLFEMTSSEKELSKRFKQVAQHLESFNSPEMQAKRKAFARDNSYERQVDRIERRLQENGLSA
jgi:glycosyltransferase involved in cell wall biosynthesis